MAVCTVEGLGMLLLYIYAFKNLYDSHNFYILFNVCIFLGFIQCLMICNMYTAITIILIHLWGIMMIEEDAETTSICVNVNLK